MEIYRKDTAELFGHNGNDPFIATIARPVIARFVRVRLVGVGYLHFRECEVIGRRVAGEEHARLLEQTHAQTQAFLQQQADERARRDSELAAGRRGDIVKIDNHWVFVDTDNYSPAMVQVLRGGGYEGRERQIVALFVQPTDRVLEIGTAIGVVTMNLAAIVGPDNVMTYDANPAMVADARRNFVANGFDGISANVGVMRNRKRWSETESEVDFFIAHDFWGSRLHASADASDIVGVVKIPLVCLEDKLAEHRANVLVCDIEGGEAALLADADLSMIKLIILETHYWSCGRDAIDALMRFLVLIGFNINLDHTGNQIVVLERKL